MTRLGQLLVRADLVTENHLARALGVQHFAGGRIGTLLLERGALHEDDLGRTLAQQHNCDYVPWSLLGNISPAAIAALPAKFAIRHSAVPYDRGEGFLRIALRDPSDLRILDELFFVTGRKIVPGVAPEVRIFQALEKYYGERRTPRYAILAEKLSRVSSRPAGKSVGPPPPPDFFPDSPSRPGSPAASLQGAEGGNRELSVARIPDAPVTPWAPVAPPPGGSAVNEEEEVISWEELSPPSLWIPEPIAPAGAEPHAVPSVASAPAPKPVPAPASAPVVVGPRPGPSAPPALPAAPAPERPAAIPRPRPAPKPLPPRAPAAPPARMPPPAPAGATRLAPETFDFPGVLAAEDRAAVVAEALAALSRRFARAAVFGSKPDRISGLAGVGAGIDAAKVAAVDVPWSDPSVFLNVRLSRTFYLGALPPLPRHRPIAEAMGRWANECVVQPVWIKEKPVAFLYAEFDTDRGATPMDLAYLRGLAAAAATALAASIRSKRGP
jgi:MshEN domain